ncbi:uncharacterized protein [Watersipora subatra]|uniref:uncharacterized protein isoform X2 n=1 Tax=Watersipora subatra TaxID=2589382 RepID=UPI00355C0AB2
MLRTIALAALISIASASFLPFTLDLDALKRPTEPTTNYESSNGLQQAASDSSHASLVPRYGSTSGQGSDNPVTTPAPADQPLLKLQLDIAKLRALLAKPNIGAQGTLTINLEEGAISVDSHQTTPSPTEAPTAVETGSSRLDIVFN